MKQFFLFLISIILFTTATFAHSGRTDASGCHNDRKNGGYHCHNSRNYDNQLRKLSSQSEFVIFNQKTKKIHRPSCKSAKGCTVNCITLKKSEAILRKGVACGNCGG